MKAQGFGRGYVRYPDPLVPNEQGQTFLPEALVGTDFFADAPLPPPPLASLGYKYAALAAAAAAKVEDGAAPIPVPTVSSETQQQRVASPSPPLQPAVRPDPPGQADLTTSDVGDAGADETMDAGAGSAPVKEGD